MKITKVTNKNKRKLFNPENFPPGFIFEQYGQLYIVLQHYSAYSQLLEFSTNRVCSINHNVSEQDIHSCKIIEIKYEED